MDLLDHIIVRRRRGSRLDVDDQVRPILVARLGQVGLVSDPLHIALRAVAGVRVVGRADQSGRRGHVPDLAPAQPARVACVLVPVNLSRYQRTGVPLSDWAQSFRSGSWLAASWERLETRR